MGLSSLCLGFKITRQYRLTIQVGNLRMYRDLSWILTISCRISSCGSKPSNWSYIDSTPCGFCDESSTVPFIREDIITPNCTELVHQNSKSGAPENIDLMDTWSTPYLEKYPSKTRTHMPRVAPRSLVSEGVSVSEVIKCKVSERF